MSSSSSNMADNPYYANINATARPAYPEVSKTVELLLSSAERAVRDARVEHPEDIATAMINALEVSWSVIVDCHKNL